MCILIIIAIRKEVVYINKKFKTVIFVGLILFVILMNVSVYASDDSFDLNLKENTNLLVPGDTLNLNMIISNINVSDGEKGISGFTARLSFDENIFEYVSIAKKMKTGILAMKIKVY